MPISIIIISRTQINIQIYYFYDSARYPQEGGYCSRWHPQADDVMAWYYSASTIGRTRCHRARNLLPSQTSFVSAISGCATYLTVCLCRPSLRNVIARNRITKTRLQLITSNNPMYLIYFPPKHGENPKNRVFLSKVLIIRAKGFQNSSQTP